MLNLFVSRCFKDLLDFSAVSHQRSSQAYWLAVGVTDHSKVLSHTTNTCSDVRRMQIRSKTLGSSSCSTGLSSLPSFSTCHTLMLSGVLSEGTCPFVGALPLSVHLSVCHISGYCVAITVFLNSLNLIYSVLASYDLIR